MMLIATLLPLVAAAALPAAASSSADASSSSSFHFHRAQSSKSHSGDWHSGGSQVGGAGPSNGDLKNIKHIVLFMQENRAFDHYFGTMRGVRGFQDPNVHISKNTNKTVWHQSVDGFLLGPPPPPHVKEMLPFHLSWQGGDWSNRCLLYTSDAADE